MEKSFKLQEKTGRPSHKIDLEPSGSSDRRYATTMHDVTSGNEKHPATPPEQVPECNRTECC